MTDSWCLVVNPAAGNGRGVRRLPAVLGALDADPACVQVCETASLGHAAEVAAGAAGRGEKVVAVGGDGLVGSVAAALAGTGGVLGIVPAGRGNDFARMLGIPLGMADAARADPSARHLYQIGYGVEVRPVGLRRRGSAALARRLPCPPEPQRQDDRADHDRSG